MNDLPSPRVRCASGFVRAYLIGRDVFHYNAPVSKFIAMYFNLMPFTQVRAYGQLGYTEYSDSATRMVI